MAIREGPHPRYPTVLVEVLVWYKTSVPDPEQHDLGERIQGSGYSQVKSADCAKYFRLKLSNTTKRKARADAKKIALLLLANPVTETFKIRKVEKFVGGCDENGNSCDFSLRRANRLRGVSNLAPPWAITDGSRRCDTGLAGRMAGPRARPRFRISRKGMGEKDVSGLPR